MKKLSILRIGLLGTFIVSFLAPSFGQSTIHLDDRLSFNLTEEWSFIQDETRTFFTLSNSSDTIFFGSSTTPFSVRSQCGPPYVLHDNGEFELFDLVSYTLFIPDSLKGPERTELIHKRDSIEAAQEERNRIFRLQHQHKIDSINLLNEQIVERYERRAEWKLKMYNKLNEGINNPIIYISHFRHNFYSPTTVQTSIHLRLAVGKEIIYYGFYGLVNLSTIESFIDLFYSLDVSVPETE
ncbi:MAG: hypothetical protein QNK23_18095 [Crocinitomicaceae bacterium]|nr:hypothetical protein [Crocinitomicaceae bacterium]